MIFGKEDESLDWGLDLSNKQNEDKALSELTYVVINQPNFSKYCKGFFEYERCMAVLRVYYYPKECLVDP